MYISYKGRILQSPKLELLCDTGAQVDCLNIRQLLLFGLFPDDLFQPEVRILCKGDLRGCGGGLFWEGVCHGVGQGRREAGGKGAGVCVKERLGYAEQTCM